MPAPPIATDRRRSERESSESVHESVAVLHLLRLEVGAHRGTSSRRACPARMSLIRRRIDQAGGRELALTAR